MCLDSVKGMCAISPLKLELQGTHVLFFFVKRKGKSGGSFFSREMGTLDYLAQGVTVEVSSGIFVFLTKGTDKGCLR